MWVCPGAWSSDEALARALFDTPASVLQAPSSAYASETDFLVIQPDENTCGTFPGTTIVFEGERRRKLPHIPRHDRVYLLGPYEPSSRTMPVYNVALWYAELYASHPEYFDLFGQPRRLQNNGTHFMVYMTSSCVPFRDKAYQRLNALTSQQVHVGQCPRPVKGTAPFPKAVKAVAPPPRSNRDENPYFFSQYRFVLCMENFNDPGYVTEKLLNALLSGAIPIYYGSKG